VIAVFVDEPVSIYAHSDWSEAQRRQAGAMTTSAEHLKAVFTAGAAPDPKIIDTKVLFDHATNDWQDVLRHKIDVPTTIFSGEYSHNLPSQRWMASVIPGASLQVYSQAEQGDHFLMFKNPMRFVRDLRAFLDR
jgi:pimeloyl-ACP methyl ester carboxylesterase